MRGLHEICSSSPWWSVSPSVPNASAKSFSGQSLQCEFDNDSIHFTMRARWSEFATLVENWSCQGNCVRKVEPKSEASLLGCTERAAHPFHTQCFLHLVPEILLPCPCRHLQTERGQWRTSRAHTSWWTISCTWGSVKFSLFTERELKA